MPTYQELLRLLKPPRGFRLTKPGRIFFAFLAGIIIVALLTGNNLLYLVLALMLAFMIISGLESERNIRHLEIERIFPAEVYARTPSHIGYRLRNRSNASQRLVIKDLDSIKIMSLPQGEGGIFFTDFAFERRGRVKLGSLAVYTTYPYGLFEKSISFSLRDECIVFPEARPAPAAVATGLTNAGAGHSIESISHLRPYVPGDAGTLIAWKRLHRGLFSRVTEGGTGTRGIVVLTPGGNREEKLSQAVFLIGRFALAGAQFGLALNAYFSGLGGSREHKLEILTRLALADTIGEPPHEALDGQTHLIYL